MGATREGTVEMSERTFASLFPFHFVIAPDGALRRLGPALLTTAPALRVGAMAADVLEVAETRAAASFEELGKRPHEAVLIRAKVGGLLLRGEVAPLGDGLLFVGSPWILEDEKVTGVPVDGSLYAAHDPTADLGELLTMQNFALEEAHDVATRLETQRHELASRNDELKAKHETILRLSAPTLRLWEDVLAVPIVGTLDTDRVEAIMRAIAEHLTRHSARFVVVDLTGADAVDTTTVRALASLASVARMLGARFMLTGIQPEIGQTIVDLGLDLTGFDSFVNVSDALRSLFAETAKQKRGLSPRARLARARHLATRVLADETSD